MLSLLSLALSSALVPTLAAPQERPYLTPWVIVRPTATAPPAAGHAPATLSVNAPGLLVEVRAAEVGEPATAARSAASSRRPRARAAGPGSWWNCPS
ncbi:MAG: hypothetical protein IPL90_18400 [Holophagales bacterium]|nr:hypothetical protein [Holophagales bacterium]